MNEETPPPLEAVGDSPIEARIVAWVLGDASAFEAAELERLCEERPELLVFRRRMRALHGLLTEAEASEADHSWKLPPEKRKVLDEIFGEEGSIRPQPARDLSIRRSGRRMLLAMAACVVLGVMLLKLFPRGHESQAVIEVRPRTGGMDVGFGSRGVSPQSAMKPQFFGIEFEKIKSTRSLAKVVDDLDLTDRWKMDKDAAVRRLKKNVSTENIKGTDLIAVRVREKDEQESKEIVNKVVETYRDYRRELETRDSAQALVELNKAVRDQEDKVEERRKVLASIVRTKGIIYKGQDSFYGQAGVDEDKAASSALETYNELESQKQQLESQINSLAKYDGDQTMRYASGLELPENIVGHLYPHYIESQRKLSDLKIKGLGEGHPTVKAQEEQIAAMKLQMDEGVVNLRATLQAQLNMASDRLKKVEIMKDKTREDSIARGLDAQDYVDAKREFETDQELLQTMKLAQINKSIQAKQPDESVVIHESPLFPQKSARMAMSAGKPSAPAMPESEFAANEDRPAAMSAPAPPATHAPARPDSSYGMAFAKAKEGLQQQARRNRIAGRVEWNTKASAASAAESLPELADSEHFESIQKPGAGGLSGAFVGGGVEGGTLAGGPVEESRISLDAAGQGQAGLKRSDQRDVANTVVNGLRSGDSAVSRNSIDAILGSPTGTAMPTLANRTLPHGESESRDSKSEWSLQSVAGDKLASDSSEKDEASNDVDATLGLRNVRGTEITRDLTDGIPTLGDLPMLGRLHSGNVDTDFYSAAASEGVEIAGSEPSARPMPWESTGAGRDFRPAGGEINGRWNTAFKFDSDAPSPEGSESDGKLAQAMTDGNVGNDEGAIASNPALTDEHVNNVNQVRRGLYTAEGNFNLGKYDVATKSYMEVLKTDPYNKAARRGLERIATARSDYYRAAYDHTRAELLSQVDDSWELAVPADKDMKETSKLELKSIEAEKSDQDQQKNQFNDLAQREMIRRQDAVNASDQLATDAKKEIAQGNIQEGRLKFESALKQLPDSPLTRERRVTLEKSLADTSQYFFRGKDLATVNPEPVTVDLASLMEEISASEDPYSTFSLNISDASFQLAKAALAKGERPDPEGIKPEQFYNAVDYGDPSPSADQPVAATIEQSAHPVIPGRELVRVALRTASVGRAASQPLRLTLLIDQSGSMVREDRRAAMENAMKQLGGLLTKNDSITIIGFSRTPHLLADGLTGDQGARLGEIINQAASEGGTNLEEAMKLAAEKAAEKQLEGAQNRIVLFTDGAANLGNADPERLAKQVTALRQQGIAFDIAGIGADGLNDRLLGELARHGNGRYHVVGNDRNDSFARQLAGAFRPAAENVKVQVNFNPRRVGKYKLIGFEKDRLKTEDFRNDSVDAAELAADEAGVALYQVEPLADGAGEIGEVSVRFRDVASGEMVERTWTIPYESSATAFDRATPSMQLAGLSLLAAGKLKGGPMADAIDFRQFAAPLAEVRQFYGASPRVADMLRVIDALK